ncbi:MAG: hypothetical protein ABSH32_25595, partial [Bryobacteraceae bacterium]
MSTGKTEAQIEESLRELPANVLASNFAFNDVHRSVVSEPAPFEIMVFGCRPERSDYVRSEHLDQLRLSLVAKLWSPADP